MPPSKSALDVLASMHRPDRENLIPAAALSVVLWIDEDGNEEVTVYVAQTVSGCTAVGMLGQAQHVMNTETLGCGCNG